MSEPFDVVMVGGGNMGAALAQGMLDGGSTNQSFAIVEQRAERRDELVEMFPSSTVTDTIPACVSAIIAVKPDDVSHAVASAVAAGATRIVSIAAGVTLATLEAAAGDGVAVIRAMPNTPALVGLGTSAIAAGASVDEADMAWADEVLGAVGIVERLDEPMIDAFTGVAGSGPAYVFRFAEALRSAATGEGLDGEAADRIVAQLLLGSATLLDRAGDPTQLRINVTSPGGTTAAGLARFEAHDLDAIVADVVAAATERSRELG